MVLVWVVWRFDYKLTMSKERHGRFDYKIFESANSLSNWIESSIAVWRHSCTMSFIGWTCQRGSPTRWVSWCTAVFTVRHLGTSPTISSHPLTLLRGFVCVPQTDTSSSYLAVDSTHTAVGCIPSLVRRSETRSLTISEIRRVVLTAFKVRRYALHGLCDRNSVRPSVRLSHSCTVSTWFDLQSWFLHHMVAPSF